MTVFQDYLDDALKNVSFSEKDETRSISDYDIFGEIREQIIGARIEAGMTQRDLAEKSDLTQSNISNIEKGSNRPTIATLKKIADALGKRLVVELRD